MDAHVAVAAQTRLKRSATHFGDVAAVVYGQNQGWTTDAVMELHHLSQMDDLAVWLVDGAGRTILRSSPSAPVESLSLIHI